MTFNNKKRKSTSPNWSKMDRTMLSPRTITANQKTGFICLLMYNPQTSMAMASPIIKNPYTLYMIFISGFGLSRMKDTAPKTPSTMAVTKNKYRTKGIKLCFMKLKSVFCKEGVLPKEYRSTECQESAIHVLFSIQSGYCSTIDGHVIINHG